MKPNDETIEAYKKMAKESSGADMKAQIQENLSRTCEKFAGNEDKLDRCLEYLTDCASEILGCKNGDVPDEVCFRICRDYFNDEIWKKEEEEQAEKDRRQKEAAEKKAAEKAAKKSPKKKVDPKIRKATADFEKEQAEKDRERVEKLKAKHVVKVIKPEKVITSGNVKTCQDVKTPELALAEKMKAIVEENNRKLGISEAKPINMFSEAV